MGVISTSTIVHSVRAELRISCDQYVIADAIAYLSGLRKDTSIKHLSLHLAISEENVKVACLYLSALGLITGNSTTNAVTSKWRMAFGDDKLFDNPLPRFCTTPPPDYVPGFWQVYKRQGSSKPKAMAFWNKLIKTIPAEHLIQAAKNYMESKDDPTYIMHAQRFLDPKQENFADFLPKEEVRQSMYGAPKVHKDMTSMI